MQVPSQAAIAVCLLAVSLSGSERPRSSYDPSQTHSRIQQDSLIDFVLKRLNPTDKDYGLSIEQARKSAIEMALDMLPTLCSVALLLGSFVVIVHQSRERRHREIISARFLAWYHNELLRARDTARDAIARNNGLKKVLDGQAESEPTLTMAAAADSGAPSPPVRKPGPVAGHDLVTEINRLRQQLVVQADTEKALKQQISMLNNRLQQEKQKNRALKGE
jgi:hypothetical protein